MDCQRIFVIRFVRAFLRIFIVDLIELIPAYMKRNSFVVTVLMYRLGMEYPFIFYAIPLKNFLTNRTFLIIVEMFVASIPMGLYAILLGSNLNGCWFIFRFFVNSRIIFLDFRFYVRGTCSDRYCRYSYLRWVYDFRGLCFWLLLLALFLLSIIPSWGITFRLVFFSGTFTWL